MCLTTIPGFSVAYWLSPKMVEIFNNASLMSEYANCCTGMQTGNNSIYVFYWFEVNSTNTQMFNPDGDWYRYNCGGEPRKWYGNHYNIVFWKNNGEAIRNEKSSVIRNESFFFKKGIAWKRITGSSFSLRLLPENFIFDQSGDSMFAKDVSDTNYLLAVVNSKVAFKVSECIAPTLNLTAGNMEKIPVIICNRRDEVDKLTTKNIELCKQDWDSFEVSWDFKKHPLI